MNQPSLLQDDDGAVRIITLNRPEQRNAFDIGLYHALTRALRSADTDESVRAVVLTGAGPAFSAGTDLGELAAIAAGSPPEGAADAFPGLLATLAEIDVPLIAAVQGPGVGLGATMLSFCEIVIIADISGGPRLLLGQSDDIERKVRLINAILAQVVHRQQSVSAIDVRAPATPVVVYR